MYLDRFHVGFPELQDAVNKGGMLIFYGIGGFLDGQTNYFVAINIGI